MSTVISANNLKIGYSSNSIIAHIDSLKIQKGEIVSIIGESGIGKTTLLKNIAHLLTPIKGNLTVLGNDNKPKRGEIGYIPQKLGLIKHETVFSNVLEGAICNEAIWRSITGLHDERVLKQVDKLINKMNLYDKKDEKIKLLSGGQQRRVAIARTIAQNPKLILADEFLSELDDKTANKVWNLMLSYVKENDITLVLIEHHLNRSKVADRCFMMEKEKDNNHSNITEVEL